MKRLKLLILFSLMALILTSCNGKNNNETTSTRTTEINGNDDTKPYSLVDGSEISEKDKYNPVIGIMLDNHPEAMPQSGFNKASIVYEFKVEGDFTRYLAIFQNSDAELIGPVRSARPYFVQTIAEFNGIFAHFGGSDLGMSTISKLNIDNLNGMELEGTTFYRNKEVNKISPHNAYTSIELLDDAISKKGYETDRKFDGFKFDLDGNKISQQMDNGKSATEVHIPFNSTYIVDFKYDEAKKSYEVFRNDTQIVDEADEENVYAKNIIIEFASSKVNGPAGTLEISHIGKGSGKLITEGKVIDINWSKDTATDRTIFTNSDGEEILLNPGQTWIEVVETGTNIATN
ncbi:DUF3048 domain-containing protein [Miniphocaeibacter halophilus]|uniref:DUF3048 domain-containing protein n=1 Tax=Miniphocaeibacter halophilus TaxID=2931922 RepID=A0AC61MR37_9FIRM|nr:DUF3048 domain-containing protein [Miniphocaeibacter halophilus]QQK08120.1 DUF3048 domain-containing protein [Miniphocaeibacter halophilus]